MCPPFVLKSCPICSAFLSQRDCPSVPCARRARLLNECKTNTHSNTLKLFQTKTLRLIFKQKKYSYQLQGYCPGVPCACHARLLNECKTKTHSNTLKLFQTKTFRLIFKQKKYSYQLQGYCPSKPSARRAKLFIE